MFAQDGRPADERMPNETRRAEKGAGGQGRGARALQGAQWLRPGDSFVLSRKREDSPRQELSKQLKSSGQTLFRLTKRKKNTNDIFPFRRRQRSKA